MTWRHVMLAVSNADFVPSPIVDRVGRIARRLQADVELFFSIYEPDAVLPGHHDSPVDAVIAAHVEDAHRRLERIADMFREQGIKTRSCVRWDYPVYEAVIRQVLRHEPGLLVVPARGIGDIGHRTLHYREARLIETCPCPLLLLKTPEVYSKGPIVAAVDPLHAYAAPQELDEVIVGAAKTLSHALADAPVHLYHADVPTAASAARREQVSAAVRELAERHDISTANVSIDSGAVEVALPEFARVAHAGAIVMGALSRRYAQRALLGHKAELVLDAVGCDVLVVKPRNFVCPVSREATPAIPLPGLERRAPPG